MNTGDITRIQRRSKLGLKSYRIKLLRGDEVEPTGRFRHWALPGVDGAPNKPEADFLTSASDIWPRGARRAAQWRLQSAPSGLVVPFV